MTREGETPFNFDVPKKLLQAFNGFKARDRRDKKLLGAIGLYHVCTLTRYGVVELMERMDEWLDDEETENIEVHPPGELAGAKPKQVRPHRKKPQKN